MKLRNNVLYQLLYQVVILIIPFIITPYLSRVFSPEILGVNAFVFTVSQYFVLISMLGISTHGSRAISSSNDKDDDKHLFNNLYFSHIVSSLFAIIAYLLLTLVVFKAQSLYYVFSSIYLLSALIDITWFFQGKENFKPLVIRNIFLKISSIILIFVFVKDSSDLGIYIFIMAISTFFANLIMWYRGPKLNLNLVTSDWVKHFKNNLYLFIPVAAVIIYQTIGKLMLGLMSSNSELGFFEQAEKILSIGTIAYSLGIVMLPRATSLVTLNEMEKMKKLVKYTSFLSFGIISAISFGIFSVRDLFTIVYFGEGYESVSKIIFILAPIMIIMTFANIIRALYLIPNNKDKQYINSVLIGAAINVFLNLLLIPNYGAVGAAISTGIVQIIVLIIQIYMSYKNLNILMIVRELIPFLTIGLSMSILISTSGAFFNQGLLDLVILILIGGGFYILLTSIYVYYRFYKHKEIDTVKNIFS